MKGKLLPQALQGGQVNECSRRKDSVAETGVSSITFGTGSDILSLPGLYLLFCKRVDLSEVLLQTCQPHADAAAPGHVR